MDCHLNLPCKAISPVSASIKPMGPAVALNFSDSLSLNTSTQPRFSSLRDITRAARDLAIEVVKPVRETVAKAAGKAVVAAETVHAATSRLVTDAVDTVANTTADRAAKVAESTVIGAGNGLKKAGGSIFRKVIKRTKQTTKALAAASLMVYAGSRALPHIDSDVDRSAVSTVKTYSALSTIGGAGSYGGLAFAFPGKRKKKKSKAEKI